MNYRKYNNKLPQNNPRGVEELINDTSIPNQYNNVIDRIDLQRGMLFSQDSKDREFNNTKLKQKISHKHDFGEITGHSYGKNDMIQGMPIREIVHHRNYNQFEPTNPQLDFDIYDENASYDSEDINYDNAPNEIGFADIDSDTMLKQKTDDPVNQYIFINNFMNFSLLKDLESTLNPNIRYGVSAYETIKFLFFLFISSNQDTEKILRTVFGNIDKNLLVKLLYDIQKPILESKSYISNSVILLSDQISLEPGLYKLLNNFAKIMPINYKKKDSIHQANNFFKKISGHIIFPPTLHMRSRDIVFGNSIEFNPIFRFKPNKNGMVNINFYGKSKRVETLMSWSDIKFLSSINNEYHMIELDLLEPYLGLGILIKNDYDEPNISRKEFDQLLQSLKPEKYSKIQIPMFSQRFDFSLINQFKRIGFTELTDKANLTNLSPNSYLKVKDIFQRINVNIKPIGHHKHNIGPNLVNRANENLVFSADHSFIYYLRLRPFNSIIFMSMFN